MFGINFGGESKDANHCAVAILPTSDMTAAQRFFERLGFRVEYGDESYQILSDGRGWQLHLQKAASSFLKPATPFGLYLYTDDVDRLAEEFRATPEQTEWGTYEFSLDGPDGISVQVGRLSEGS
jgi:hypothetical protein